MCLFVTKLVLKLLWIDIIDCLGAIKIVFSTHNSLTSRPLQHRPEAIIIKYFYPIASTIRNKVLCNTGKFYLRRYIVFVLLFS